MTETLHKPINVLLVDDSPAVRKVVKNSLISNENVGVVIEAGDAVYALRKIDEGFEGIVVMDLNLPDLDGIETIKQIKEKRPEISVIVMSFQSDVRYQQESFKAGASGFVLKDRANEDLPKAIRLVAGKNSFSSIDYVPEK